MMVRVVGSVSMRVSATVLLGILRVKRKCSLFLLSGSAEPLLRAGLVEVLTMKAFLWRVVIAAICVFMFWLIFPLFLSVIGFSMPGNLIALLKICVACIAVIYVLFGPAPPSPW